jgi:hypothetical protein
MCQNTLSAALLNCLKKEQLHSTGFFLLFRLHKERVFYVSEKIMKQAANVARENLISLGMNWRESRRGKGSVVDPDPVGSASFCRSGSTSFGGSGSASFRRIRIGSGIILPDPVESKVKKNQNKFQKTAKYCLIYWKLWYLWNWRERRDKI